MAKRIVDVIEANFHDVCDILLILYETQVELFSLPKQTIIALAQIWELGRNQHLQPPFSNV